MIRGITNPGRGAGLGRGVTLTGGWAGQWSARTAVPVRLFLANQKGEGVGGAGKGRDELTAQPSARRAPGEREESG